MSAGKNNPLFSFIIPTFNAGFHIERCLKSIRCQRYPRDGIEILIIDGGSADNTLDIAEGYGCRIFKNENRLAEYGVQIGMAEAAGDFSVIFAADNELIGDDWIEKVAGVFNNDKEISAVWGRLASGKDDPGLNRYFELIQSDPLSWFLNKNLGLYMEAAATGKDGSFVFRVDRARPLVWGANGLVYRAEKIKMIWSREGYLGDNDAFQSMVEQGNNKVAYFNRPFVYHHHVAKLSDWVKKWRRNFSQHLLTKHKTRNMNWIFTENFRRKLFFWVLYSSLPVFSAAHSAYLSLKNRNIYWFYHPGVSFLQFSTYSFIILFTAPGRNFLKNSLLGGRGLR